jgi:hypothetical protein
MILLLMTTTGNRWSVVRAHLEGGYTDFFQPCFFQRLSNWLHSEKNQFGLAVLFSQALFFVRVKPKCSSSQLATRITSGHSK